MTYVSLALYILQLTIFSSNWLTLKSSNSVYKFVEIHFAVLKNLEYAHFIPLYLSEICLILLSDTLLHLYVAVSKNITINELNQPWNFKYNFVTMKYHRGTEEKTGYT
jgi:hypothetical protein